jgi:simple sugar transport system permease protein
VTSTDAAAQALARVSAATVAAGIVRSTLVFLATAVTALVLAIPLIYVAGSDPIEAYSALLSGSLGGQRPIAETLVSATPLLLAGLAVAVAFQAGLFNIGVEGQLVMGGLAAGAIGAEVSLPGRLHLVAAVAGGALAGALWGLVPGLLKAWRGVHEVISTIMLNYIAFSISLWLVSPGGPLVSKTQPSATEKVATNAALPRIWEPTRLHAGIVVAAVIVATTWWFLYRTPKGYEFRLVGANPTAARFNGIATRRLIVEAMLLSGGLAGLAGAVEVLGVHGRYFDSFSPGYGFDSIAVALLGLLHPVGVAAAALFFGTLRAGSVKLQSVAGLSRDVITVISGLVVACVAARVVFDRLLVRRVREDEAAAEDVTDADGAEQVTVAALPEATP